LLKAFKRILPDVFEVVFARSGQEALDLIERDGPFDVIICDIMMPGVSGDEVYHAAVSAHPELSGRFVFITGGAFTKKSSEFVRNTDNICLEKPIDGNELIGVINKMTKESKDSANGSDNG
jgi:CheY-like chemotaxis protein